MKPISFSILLPALVVVLLFLAPLPAQSAQLRVGQAAVKITPPVGMPMAGYYHVRLSEGVHDELHAKAIVLEHDGTKAALVACDLISVPIALVEQVRQAVHEATGIPAGHIMVSATHAHTGPVMTATPRGADAEATAVARAYHEELPKRIADSVKLANVSLQPAVASAAIGHADSISFVRRFLMKDGSIGWNPGKLNPDIIRPVSSIDPEVPFVYFETPDADPLAVFVNFANHLDTVGGMDFSADYPYTLARVLAEIKGPGLVTMFTAGTCGNLNHLDVSHDEPQKGHGEAARIGSVLAASVIEELPNLETLGVDGIRADRVTVELPVLRVTPAEVEAATEVMQSYGAPGARPFYEQVHAAKVLAAARLDGEPIQAEVQVIALGNDVAWVALPGEVFVELGKAIKLASPFRYTIVSELSNDTVVDYIPDRKAYAQGAYEAMSTPVAPGGGELLVETAVRLLIETRTPYPAAHR